MKTAKRSKQFTIRSAARTEKREAVEVRIKTPGRVAYETYCCAIGWVNANGTDMRRDWDALDTKFKLAWEAVTIAIGWLDGSGDRSNVTSFEWRDCEKEAPASSQPVWLFAAGEVFCFPRGTDRPIPACFTHWRPALLPPAPMYCRLPTERRNNVHT